MSHLIAGIDESLRPRNYLLCATVVSTNDRPHLRQSLRALLLPRQRRLHAKNESEGRRKLLLKSLSNISGFTCVLLFGAGCDESDRDECLRVLGKHLIDRRVREIVLERIDPGTADRDRAVMQSLEPDENDLQWRHEAAEHEPLLWISDIVAHAYGGGGEWRRAADLFISTVLTLED